MEYNKEWDALQTAVETVARELLSKGENPEWVKNVCKSTVDHVFDNLDTL